MNRTLCAAGLLFLGVLNPPVLAESLGLLGPPFRDQTPGQDHPGRGWGNFETFVGDVNGDGFDDLIWNATTSINRTYVGIMDSAGMYLPLPKQDRSETNWENYKTLTADVNGDGLVDLIWNATTNVNRTYVGLAQSDGTFQFGPVQQLSNSGWYNYKTLAGDVNGDGRTDLIWNATTETNRIYVGVAQGDGTFQVQPVQQLSNSGWSSYQTLTGDVNGDGRTDLIWNATGDNNRVYVGLASETSGKFVILPVQQRSEHGWDLFETLTGDVNGDGHTDLIWNATHDNNKTYVGLGQPDGTFQFLPSQERPESGWDAYKALTGDMNGDGRTDLIWISTGTISRVYISYGNI